jgi:multiple sugar transport system substrate-binding protein
MRTGKWLVVILGLLLASVGTARAQTVEIEYWQYTFAQRVQAIDELIKRFEAENPNIKVKQTTVPYDDFRLKIAAAIPAGQGPDVVQLFYGWLQDYLKAKLLQPLPPEIFPAAEIERDFFPLVKQMKVDGQYYAVPTAVRSLALFWNKKLFAEAGLDPAKPPQTLDEMLDMAKKLTKRDAAGRYRARHGPPGPSLATRGADPADGRPALLGGREERGLQHAGRPPGGGLVHRPRHQAQGR